MSAHPSAQEHRLTAPRQSELSVLLCLAAGKVSEPRIASYQQMQDSRVVLVGLDSRKPAPNLIRLPAWKLPYLGAPERWTTGLNWYRRRRFNHLEPGRVDVAHQPTRTD